MIVAALVALSLAATPASPAAAPSAGPTAPSLAEHPALTLDEAVTTALARRPSLRAARGQSAAAEASAREVRGALLPQVALGAGYTLRRDWPAGGGSSVSGDSASASVSADLLLWDFERTPSRLRAARAAADATGRDEVATERDVVLEVRVAYLGALATRALEAVAQETLANQERHLAETRAMVEAGTRAAIDLARLRTQVASARAAHVAAANDVRTAAIRLAVAMGAPGEDVGELAWPALPALAAEGEPTDALFAQAVHERPELASLRASVLAQSYTVTATERSLWPSLRLGADGSAAGEELRDRPALGASVGVRLSWPIFDGLSSRGATDAARARLDVAEAQLGDLEQRVFEEIDAAATAVASARAQLPAAEEAHVAARELVGLAEARYREGVGSSLELADAELELASAAARRVQVEYDLASARAGLLRALGRERWE